MSSVGEDFAREPNCGVCQRGFNLLRRRHHCRRCSVAVCKDCGAKAVDRRKGDTSKPQWYCYTCIEEDEQIEVDKNALNKRRAGANATINEASSFASIAKFCVECGYELPPRVKFCIECGTAVPTMDTSSDHADTNGITNSQSRSSLTDSNLPVIDELVGYNSENQQAAPKEAKEEESVVSEAESAAETADTVDNQSAEKDEHLRQLQSENENLRNALEKMKQKAESAKQRVAIAEQKRQEEASARQRAESQVSQVQAQAPPAPAPAPSSESPSAATSGVAAKDHPDFVKYFKLLKMGMPEEQVQLKMSADGVDTSVLSEPDKIIGGSGNAQAESSSTAGEKTVKDDEKYSKYFKLLKMGMPAEQVKMKMSAAGDDPNLLDTPDAPIDGGSSNAAPMKVSEDPAFEKYFKLLKMGMPAEQVKMKMSAAGDDPSVLDDPNAVSPNAQGASQPTANGLPPPKEAVKVDPSALQATLASKNKKEEKKEESGPKLPKKDPIQPNVELRPLFWSRVPVNVVSSTMWMQLDDKKPAFDVPEMEWMFRKNVVEAPKKKEDKKEDNKPKQVLLLDGKRQQNVSIAMTRFRMTASEISKAIYALDTNVLTSEMLNVLISISPTLEEQDLLKNYDGDVNLLGNVEKFFLELLKIPRYTQRIKCIRFRLQFENRILETQEQLDTLAAATDQVADSANFRGILEHVLAIGNYLNGSTPRGGAYGFRLDTLTKLHTLKSVDPRVTLLHYVVRQLEERNPDLIAVVGELKHIPTAKRLSLDQLRADLKAYNTELAMLQGQVQASKKDDISYDRFYEDMAPFAKDAGEVLEELGRDFSQLETSYNELVSSLGEDPRKLSPVEFFTVLDEFLTEFKKAYRQNQTKEFQTIFEKAKKEREEAEAKKMSEQEARHAEETKEMKERLEHMLSSWAQQHDESPDDVHRRFDDAMKNFKDDQVTADEFCMSVKQIVGAKAATKILPDAAALISKEEKRNAALAAVDRFTQQVKKDKEERKKRKKSKESLFAPDTSSEEKVRPKAPSSSPPKRGAKIPMINVDDIEPVVGEEAHQLHTSIIEAVQQAFQGDTKKMKRFTSNTRKYGSEKMTAREFYQYLMDSFEPDFVGRLVPDLARLLQDREKRHALIIALCESAPGWAKFSGL